MKRAVTLLFLLLCAVCVFAEEEVRSVSTMVEVPFDLRDGEVRTVEDADSVFPFAYNNTVDWRSGGDGSAAMATIRLTEMYAYGMEDEPSSWSALPSVSNVVCGAAEGALEWGCDKRTYYRAELQVAGEAASTAYLDLSAAEGEWAKGSVQILDFARSELVLYEVADGGYYVEGRLRDRCGRILTADVDYRLEVVLPATGIPASVTVIGIGSWSDQVVVPLSAHEVVAAWSTVKRLSFDSRPFVDGVRATENAQEVQPFTYNNAGDWRCGGSGPTPAATIAATPVVPLKDGGEIRWLPIGASETLVTAGGEGVYGAWSPTADSYRVTLTANDTVLESVVVDMSGREERKFGRLSVANLNWPQIGQPLEVSLADAGGNALSPAKIVWRRQTADRGTVTMLSEDEAAYTPTADDLEHWLTLSLGGDSGDEAVITRDIWISKLPVVYVTTDDGLWPTPAKEDHSGTFRLQGNGRWKKDSVLYDGVMDKIHVRGNSTKDFPKKPYKLKLDKKADLLGMGKNKHWALLANYQDPGLMCNKTTYDFSAELGLAAMASEWVDVIFNGEFVGNYQLCEHIRIDKERINIHNWEDTAEETAGTIAAAAVPEKGDARKALEEALTDSMTADLGWLTTGMHTLDGVTYTLADYGVDVSEFDLSGGYIYELDAYDDEPSNFRVTSGNIRNTLVKIKSPETLHSNSTLMEEQRLLWQDFFDAVQSEDGYANGKSWAEIADVRSMAAYWLTQVLAANYDVPRSRYAYKDQGGPLVFGPAWDFDGAYGGWAADWNLTADANGVITAATEKYQVVGWLNGVAPQLSEATYNNFYPYWVDDPYFCLALYELWREHRDYFFALVADGGTLDQYYDYLLEAGLANDARWQVKSAGPAYDRFDGELGSARRLKQCLSAQIRWIDRQMTSLSTLVASLQPGSCDHPYTDARDKLELNCVSAHRQRLGDAESDLPDFLINDAEDWQAHLAIAGLVDPAKVDVYVNGIACGTYPVGVVAAVDFTVNSNRLTHTGHHRNVVSLMVRDGEDQLLATTYALVTRVAERYAPRTVRIAVRENETDPRGWPIVTVKTDDGRALLEGRDYVLAFETISETEIRVRVTGLGSYESSELAEGQINYVGVEELVFESGERVEPTSLSRMTAKLDMRDGAVWKPMMSWELLPFTWNNSACWPKGGEGDVFVSVSLQPMKGDPADPSGWTPAGEESAIVNAAGEGVKRVRGLSQLLYKAKLADGDAINEEAYLDLSEMKVLPATIFYLR